MVIFVYEIILIIGRREKADWNCFVTRVKCKYKEDFTLMKKSKEILLSFMTGAMLFSVLPNVASAHSNPLSVDEGEILDITDTNRGRREHIWIVNC